MKYSAEYSLVISSIKFSLSSTITASALCFTPFVSRNLRFMSTIVSFP